MPTMDRLRTLRRETALSVVILLGAVLSLGALVFGPRPGMLVEDEEEYLNGAVHLVRSGVHSRAPIEVVDPPPDAYREPGVAATIALAWRLGGVELPSSEPELLAAAGNPVRTVHVLVIAITAAAAGLAARTLGARPAIAAAVVLFVVSSPALRHWAVLAMAEPMTAMLLTIGALASLRAFTSGGGWTWMWAAALAFGTAPLWRAATIVVLPLVALLPAARRELSLRRRVAAAMLLLIVAILPASAWSLRNAVALGHFQMSDRNGMVMLARAELDSQIGQEGLAPALLEFAPLHALRQLRTSRYPTSRLAHFSWTGDGNYWTRAGRQWFDAIEVTGDPLAANARMARVAVRRFLEAPADHLVATVATTWRGAFAERAPPWVFPLDDVAIVVVAAFLSLANGALLWRSARSRDLRPWLLMAPSIVFFAFHALATEGLPRFAAPLLPVAWTGALCALDPRCGRRSAPASRGHEILPP